MVNLSVVVTYFSYANEREIGALSCDEFQNFTDFAEHIAAVAKLIPRQFNYDPIYNDVWQAEMVVRIDGKVMENRKFRRHAGMVKVWSGAAPAILV